MLTRIYINFNAECNVYTTCIMFYVNFFLKLRAVLTRLDKFRILRYNFYILCNSCGKCYVVTVYDFYYLHALCQFIKFITFIKHRPKSNRSYTGATYYAPFLKNLNTGVTT